jgi:hypothetical protein
MKTTTSTIAALTLDMLPALGEALDGGIFAGITTTKEGVHVAVVLPDAWCWRLQRFERYFLVVLVLVVWTELLAWALAPGWRLGSTLCDLAGIGLSAL